MRLIRNEEEFLESGEIHYKEVYNYDELPEKYPFYMYTYDGGDGVYYKALYIEELKNMITKLEGV